MADFGGMQEYTTPDGRRVQLPPQQAALFSQSLTPVPPELLMAPDQGEPMGGPVDASLLQSPPVLGAPPDAPMGMGPMPQGASDSPSQGGPAPPGGGYQDAALIAPEVAAPPQAPRENPVLPPPAPRGPTTAADLRAVGAGQIYDQERGALGQARAADVAQVQADAGVAQERAKALEDHAKRQAAIDQQTIAIVQAKAADVAQKEADRSAAIEKWANTKIDTSTRHPILAGIGMAMSLLGQAMGATGENQAMAALNRQRDRNVQMQLTEREHQGKALGLRKEQIDALRKQYTDPEAFTDVLTAIESRRFKTSMDMIAAGSSDKSVQAKLQKLGANVAAEEVSKLASASTKQQAADDRAAAAQAAARAAAEAQRHTRVTEAQGWTGLADKRRDSERDFRLKAADHDLKRQGLELEAQKLTAAGNLKGAEDIRQFGIGGPAKTDPKTGAPVPTSLMQADGRTPYLARSADQAAKLANTMHVGEQLVDVIDRIRAIRARSGGESAAANSDDYRELKMLENKAAILAKDGTEGLSSENDMKLVTGAAAVTNTTTFRALDDTLKAARGRVVQELNSKLRKNQYTGAPISFADPNEKTPQQTADEERFAKIAGKPSVSYDTAFDQALGYAKKGYTPQQLRDPKISAEIMKQAKGEAERYKDISPDQKRLIWTYRDSAMSGGPKSGEARKALENAAAKADTEAVRREAQSALEGLGRAEATRGEAAPVQELR